MINWLKERAYQWSKSRLEVDENEELGKILELLRLAYTSPGDAKELRDQLGSVGFRLDAFRRQRYLSRAYFRGEPGGRRSYVVPNPLYSKGEK